MARTVNLLTGNIRREMLYFAIPMIVTQICQQVYQLTDAVIIGQILGDAALAAVGVSTPLVFLFIALARGLSMGSSIMVPQDLGAGRCDQIPLIAQTLYISIIFFSVAITIIGVLCAPWIMRMMGVPEEIMGMSEEYFSIYLTGLVFLFVTNAITGLLTSIGDSVTPLIFVAGSVLVNIALDLIFVLVFGWGIAGVAWATVITQALVIVVLIIYTNRKIPMIGLPLRSRFDKALFSRSMKLGIPTGAQQVFVSLGMIFIMSVVSSFGVDVIAGYTSAARIEGFIHVIPIDLGAALTTFTAQNYGAKQIGRINKGIKETLRISAVICVSVLILLYFLGPTFMRMFTRNEDVIRYGDEYLMVIGLTFMFFNTLFAYTAALRGVGNTVFPMIVTSFTLVVLRIPTAYLLSATSLGEWGIWLSSPISWFVGMIISMAYWYRVQHKKLQQ